MKKTTEKKYDCVKSIRKERERIARETAGKTPKEIVQYFGSSKKKKD